MKLSGLLEQIVQHALGTKRGLVSVAPRQKKKNLAVDTCSARLMKVRIETRGFLRDGLPAGRLLAAWGENFRSRWGGRGIALEVHVCPRLHRRQILLLGASSAVEVEMEWACAPTLRHLPTSSWLRMLGS